MLRLALFIAAVFAFGALAPSLVTRPLREPAVAAPAAPAPQVEAPVLLMATYGIG